MDQCQKEQNKTRTKLIPTTCFKVKLQKIRTSHPKNPELQLIYTQLRVMFSLQGTE